MKSALIIGSIISLMTQVSFATIDLYSTNLPPDAFPKEGYKEIMERIEKETKERKEKGYLERESGYYEHYHDIENKIKYYTLKSVHLKKSFSKLNLVPNLKKVPNFVKSETFGYDGIGSFNKDVGWTGVAEIFKTKASHICHFMHNDLQASGGGYSLSEEDAQYDVNGKYTIVEVTGIPKSGFDYKVNWLDKFNDYTLTCINKDFSPEFTQYVINLAKEIDASW